MRNVGSVLLLFVLSALAGCGGGGGKDGGGSADELFTGRVRAMTVVDMDYETAGRRGRTASDGAYQYTRNSTVRFCLRRLCFGEIPADVLISLLHLSSNPQAAALIARLVASIDADNNLTNGITFTEGAMRFFEHAPAIDFTAPGAETQVMQLLTDLSRDTGATYELISAQTLFDALTDAERCVGSGVFFGTLSAPGTIADLANPGKTLPIVKQATVYLAIVPPLGTVSADFSGKVTNAGENAPLQTWKGHFETTTPLSIGAPTTFTAQVGDDVFTGTLLSADVIDLKLAPANTDTFAAQATGSTRLTRRMPSSNVLTRFVTRMVFDPNVYVTVDVSEKEIFGMGMDTNADWVDVFFGPLQSAGAFDIQTGPIARNPFRLTGTYDAAQPTITGDLFFGPYGVPLGYWPRVQPWQGCKIPQ